MYPVFEILQRDQLEQLGTKPKFWFHDKKIHGQKILCKLGRYSTGENWAEKVACELAKLLGLPAATYELASWNAEQAVISTLFVPEEGRLVHGNELLSLSDGEGYDEERAFKLKQYRLETVFNFWSRFDKAIQLPFLFNNNDSGLDHSILDLFAAYLMFDCWIGNQDRHDQNWGIILDYNKPEGERFFLAPSFDHASSLACRMSDVDREKRLRTSDDGFSIVKFAEKAKTPFYSTDGGKRLSTLECFHSAAILSRKPAIMRWWLSRLNTIAKSDIEYILTQVPPEFGMSEITIEFTLKYLELNKQRLLELDV